MLYRLVFESLSNIGPKYREVLGDREAIQDLWYILDRCYLRDFKGNVKVQVLSLDGDIIPSMRTRDMLERAHTTWIQGGDSAG